MIEKFRHIIYLLNPFRLFIFEKIRLYFLKRVIFFKRVFIYNCVFEGYNRIATNTTISNCYIGRGTYIGSNSQLLQVYLGRFCCIGDKVNIGLGNHPTSKFVSVHPAFFSPIKQAGFTFIEGSKSLFKEYKYVRDNYRVEIGNDVWIGNNVAILDGIKVGDGAVLAAGAVITKDVLPYSIVGGVPAKHIKDRFCKEDIAFLLKFRWWEKDMEWLKSNSRIFVDINLLKEKYGLSGDTMHL